jgi:hypothetical protein
MFETDKVVKPSSFLTFEKPHTYPTVTELPYLMTIKIRVSCYICVRFLDLYRPVVTLCTTTSNTQKPYVLPIQCVYVFCTNLRTKTAILSYTALTDWCL